MKKFLATVVTASAFFSCAGLVFAAEEYPTQEATVTMTVSTPDGTVLKEETISDTTKGADTTAQYKALQKTKSAKEKDAAASEKK
ncbi:MAG: hypothetical protein EHM79_08575 [Geobacter sp.]|nr:MAG: hypothetical protein EHM79_08575 [Geobacter sp.]